MEAAAFPQQRFGLGGQRDQARGYENAQNIISAAYLKDASDPQ